MKLRLEDGDGTLITYADAPIDPLPLAPLEWNGDPYRPFGTYRIRPNDSDEAVIALYRRYTPLSDAERARIAGQNHTIAAAPRPPARPAIRVTDPNTPRRVP